MAFGKLQAGRFNAALQSIGRELELPAHLLRPLVDVYGNCTQALEHNGPVTLEYEPTAGATDGALTINAGDGLALNVTGNTQFSADFDILGGAARLVTKFRNDSGEVAPAHCLLRPTGMVTIAGKPVLTCGKPNNDLQPLYFINSGSDVPANGIGKCAANVLGKVLYDTAGTPAYGESWGAKPSEWKLFANRPGFLITGGASLGKVWCVGYTLREVIAKLTAALAPGGTATADVWSGAVGAEVDSTLNITAADWLLQAPATSLASGTKVLCTWRNGKWYVDNWQPKAHWAKVTLPSALGASTASLSGCTVARYSLGSSPGGTITIHNELSIEGASGAGAYCLYDDDDDRYYIVQCPCP